MCNLWGNWNCHMPETSTFTLHSLKETRSWAQQDFRPLRRWNLSWHTPASVAMLSLINLMSWNHTKGLVAHIKPNLGNSRASYECFHFQPLEIIQKPQDMQLLVFRPKFLESQRFLGVQRETMRETWIWITAQYVFIVNLFCIYNWLILCSFHCPWHRSIGQMAILSKGHAFHRDFMMIYLHLPQQ